MRTTVPFVLLAMLGLSACERQVLGETYEGQRGGGRSMVVTGDAPPLAASTAPNAPASEPPALTGIIPTGDSDPAIRGQLLGSGGLGAPSLQPRRPRPMPRRGGPPGMPPVPPPPPAPTN